MKIVAFLLTAFLFVGCSGVNKVAHIDEFNMEVLATPEVRGVGKSLSSDTSVVRMALNVHVVAQEKEELSGIVNKRSSCKFRCDDAEDFELKEYLVLTNKRILSIVMLDKRILSNEKEFKMKSEIISLNEAFSNCL